MSHLSPRRLARHTLIIALVMFAHRLPSADAGVIGGELPELMVEGRAETFHVSMYGEQVLFLYCAERPESIDADGSLAHIYSVEDQVIVVSRAQRKQAPLGTPTADTPRRAAPGSPVHPDLAARDWLPGFESRHRFLP